MTLEKEVKSGTSIRSLIKINGKREVDLMIQKKR